MIDNPSSFKALLHTQNQHKNINYSQNPSKPQYIHSINKITNGNICIISDQYSKIKLTQLQQQISRLRKQMSQKQSFYSKQKGNLLNKLQIVNSENIQLKQRQNHLIKINETLQLAISSTQIGQKSIINNQVVEEIKEQLNEKNKLIKQSKKNIEEYKKIIRNLEAEKYHIIQQKQKSIFQLTNKCKILKKQKEQILDQIKKDIETLPFKKQMINMIIKSLTLFNQSSEASCEDFFIQESQYLESPITKRRYQDQKGFNTKQSKYFDQSYSRFSSNSIINQLNKRQITSQYSQQYEQNEKLLCEVCKKVFDEQQFIMHMDQCNQINQLHKKRSQLQKAIEELNIQQRKSISQKKKNTQRNVALEQWDENIEREISRNKINKISTIQKTKRQPQQIKKIGNRSQIFNNYISNRIY